MRRYRRILGIPLIVAAFFLAHYSSSYWMPSALLIVSGESLRIWAAGHLRKDQLLTTGGPYRAIRNPLYVGSFLIAIGFFLVAGSKWIMLLILAYFLLSYLPVVRYEEHVLLEKFPDDFAEYFRRIPAFLPSGVLWRSASTRFSWKQVWKNKEYNAILGIIAFYLVLMFLRR